MLTACGVNDSKKIIIKNIILELIVSKVQGKVRTEIIWLRTGSSSGLFLNTVVHLRVAYNVTTCLSG